MIRIYSKSSRVLCALCALLFVMTLVGCSQAMQSADSFVAEVVSRYPQLEQIEYEVDTVERVVDGDTFVIGDKIKVRMIGVDTPETVKSGSPVEQYGKEASDFTKKRLTGKTVYLFRDAGNTDRYGRLLRYVFVADDPVMFNIQLMNEGFANVMTIQPNVAFVSEFLQAERAARQAGTGLWADSSDMKAAETSEQNSNSPTHDAATNQAEPSEEGASNQAVETCEQPLIKGNIKSSKERIYHLPDGRYYERTQAEVMFCTEQEAIDSGFRKSGF